MNFSRRWEGTIKLAVKEIACGDVDCIHLVRDID
jgi:hypothetical protein